MVVAVTAAEETSAVATVAAWTAAVARVVGPHIAPRMGLGPTA